MTLLIIPIALAVACTALFCALMLRSSDESMSDNNRRISTLESLIRLQSSTSRLADNMIVSAYAWCVYLVFRIQYAALEAKLFLKKAILDNKLKRRTSWK